MLEKLDTYLSIVDIIICLVDFAIIYIFAWYLPRKAKKNLNKFRKFTVYTRRKNVGKFRTRIRKDF